MELVIILYICISHHTTSAGIGGSTAAYFLSDDDNYDVTVFEGEEVGGRAADVEIQNRRYEAGGSIIHNSNLYMRTFAENEKCGLGIKTPLKSETFSVLNTEGVLFQVW